MPKVAEYYAGKSIFMTGATGFMGKVLLEKLLRSCPDVGAVYILIRKKKGLSSESRLASLMACRVFEKLLAQNPKAFDKVRVVPGDILEEELGLSIQDEEELKREVQIVFSNAACVRFNMNIRDAVKNNVIGTQRMLKLAESMKKLEVFIHVSTAFSYDEVEVLDEKIYPWRQNPQDVINLLKWMDDETLAACEYQLTKPYPNTYGYTKCLAEQLVSEYTGRFPIAIARPSIVLPSSKEPMPGWVDNINGPTGVIYAASRGVLHTMYCRDDIKVDTMPVDLAINAFIILAYFTAMEKPKGVRVCNVTQSGSIDITWIEGSLLWSKYMAKYPLSYSLWYPIATGKNYKIHHKICEFLYHTIPAYFIDLILMVLGQKPFMVKVIKKLSHGLVVLEHYISKNWTFKNEYFLKMREQLCEEDKKTFDTDFSKVDPDEFMKNYILGIREFYCKEDPSTLPQARKLHTQLYYLHTAVTGLFYGLCIYFVYKICILIFNV